MSEDSCPGLVGQINKNFMELEDAIILSLCEKDEHYAELSDQRKELASHFPIESWLEGSGSPSLTNEECAGLAEYMRLTAQIEDIERRAIYYAGHRDCFLYLKKIGMV
jgi:hypothetical protein